MLIIPLHQRLSLDRFPWVTALLIAVNVLVYFGIQSRDGPAFERAAEFYQRSQLLSVEWPRLLQYLQDNGRENLVPQLQRMPAAQQAMAAVQLQAHDTGISAELMRQPPVDNHDQAGLERWHRDRERLEALLEGAVTPRHSLHYHQPSLGGLLSSMFLHGDAGHLFGNMLFLGLLGLMTELALGPWLFLSVYLLAGVGGGLFSLVRHLGEVGSALGASGAIAGLMGACCVVWGLRKIRVFYWFFIIFDYVRVPALWLLPFWLGWELWQMLASPDAGIAFDAHAGGIMTGALASFAIRKLGWERREVMDESEVEAERPDLYAATRSALGKLEFAAARELTARLVRQHPDEREAWQLRWRAWRDRVDDPAFHDAARRLLIERLKPAVGVDQEIATFNDYLQQSGRKLRLASVDLLTLANRWVEAGRLPAAEPICLALLGAAEPEEGSRRLAMRLALAWQEAGNAEAFRRIAGRLYARCPNSAEAGNLQRLFGEI
ncbi:MAG: rhomboid family intramembrane serine protease [Lysobacterales bacterium]